MNRREFIERSGALALGAALAGMPSPVQAQPASANRRRVLRVAHLTDLHVQPNQAGYHDSALGMAAAIRHAQSQPDRPELILFGGDMVMDSLAHSKAAVQAQWEVWDRVFAAEVKLPYKLCLGNHDVWGWGIHDQPEITRDPHYGKALAMERLGLKHRYYSFDQAGWHFIVLDSIQQDFATKSGYVATLDDEQFGWLGRELAATPATTPVAVLSHVPILAACVFFSRDTESSGSWLLPGSYCHIDARRIKDLFDRHPNVKVCLSGHVHLVDDVRYVGVRYLCNGAVSGNWWKGVYQEFPPAYALVDFYDDGTVDHRVIPYG